MKGLMQEAKALMAKGDTTSPAAMDFASRLRESSQKLKGTDPSLMNAVSPKWKNLVEDMRTDPEASEKLSPDPGRDRLPQHSVGEFEKRRRKRAADITPPL